MQCAASTNGWFASFIKMEMSKPERTLRHWLSVTVMYCLLGFAIGYGQVPPWLSIPDDYDAICERIDTRSDAVVLNAWKEVVYKGRGRVETSEGRALHLKARSERNRAIVQIPLLNDSQKLRHFKAWLIFSSGRVEIFEKEDGYYRANERDSLYSESMSFVLDRSGSINSDDVVFAYEYKIVERSVFLQEQWRFQNDIPTVQSSIRVTAPRGWTPQWQAMGEGTIEFSRDGGAFRWESKELASVRYQEVGRLPSELLICQVGITVMPSANSYDRQNSRFFETWNDVARFGYDAQMRHALPSLPIKERSNELGGGAANRWEAIRAICDYAQSLNYVAVSTDLNSGGGYEPVDAAKVFAKHYGDCKDMTALAISMFSSLGIESYPVMANTGGEAAVHAAWPSPYQFNHCIVGIPLEEPVDLPGVIYDEKGEAILLFDPTSKYTPVGYLPVYLQGSQILVNSEETHSLTRVPRTDTNGSVEERTIAIEMDEDGSIHGKVAIEASGHAAVFLRRICRGESDRNLRSRMRNWIALGTDEAEIESVKFADDFEGNRFGMEVRFLSLFYGKKAGSNLLVFKPVFLDRQGSLDGGDGQRRTDYVSWPSLVRETTLFKLPEGYRFDEAAALFEGESSFAYYRLAVTDGNGDGMLRFERERRMRYERIPPTRYAEAIAFYRSMALADRVPVVIVKEGGAR